MERNKIINNFLLIFSLFLMETIIGYPIDKLNTKLDLKDETRYPNGTVMGKYMYTDNDGNPVHVKYYADDGSYGVELQSVKVLDSSTDEPTSFPEKGFENAKPIESPFGSDLRRLEHGKPYYRNKYKTNDKNYKNKAKNKQNFAKSSLQYEILYQNNLQGPSPCGTDKVKVYLDKQKRITRDINALDDDQAAKYCEQF